MSPKLAFALFSVLLTYGCTHQDDNITPTSPTSSIAKMAETSDLTLGAEHAGPTPFIAFVDVAGTKISTLAKVGFTIAPLPGTASKPVSASYTIDALRARNRITDTTLTLPVFGLYANQTNTTTVDLQFTDGTTQTLSTKIATPSYTASSVFKSPQVNTARPMSSNLGFDFFVIKPGVTAPITVLDSDGNIRWVSTTPAGHAVQFRDNGFDIGDYNNGLFSREELDGTTSQVTIANMAATGFKHDLSPGPRGILAEIDLTGRQEDFLEEITPQGQSLKTWDMAQLIGDYMRSQGDDPSTFTTVGTDWFHMNSSIYDPSDDSIIVSSREEFVIKFDYQTGAVKWIMGDPTKYWYTFPSLRAKALVLTPDSLAPIGQHSLSLLGNGDLMMFNDGLQSLNLAAGLPVGASRAYSAVTAFKIDAAALTATPGFTFDDNQSIFSSLCSSAYQAPNGSTLINYSQAENGTVMRIKGLDPSKKIVFDFQFPTSYGCTNGWNSTIIPFENLVFTS